MGAVSNKLGSLAERRGHRTLAEQAFGSLHEAIVTGVLEPGERLPIEELAETLRMSPMPIREALRRLDAAGLVEHVPHRGARVTELAVDDLREVYTVRLQVEPLAVREAAARFTDDDATVARQALARHLEAVEAERLSDAWTSHTEFHFALYDAARNRWLTRLIIPLWETSERYRHASGPVEWRLSERQREHEAILEACVSRDPQRASWELHNHLAQSANQVSERMGGAPLFPLLPADDARSEELEPGGDRALASGANQASSAD